ncbi:SGNH hydrolase [Actinorhabdospora filicis]|uniref:SGNH hydrolase n=1 Tax=Actinorhabdospora filicis TaxID=1785913 RepID=A0A9W6SIF0_9ACTN|nr:SGNH/GDSL hydrolase family protein [Actinorhabdospora filicis]GLZ77665.1 SGNH hydrolase [Actinorhabdospora filicis]
MRKLGLATVLALALAAVAVPAAAEAPGVWSSAWARAMQAPTASAAASPDWSLAGFAGESVRQVLRLTAGGTKMRVTLSNRYGTRPLVVSGASVALAGAGGGIAPGTSWPLTFGGRAATVIAPGEELRSDAARLDAAALTRISVTLWFAGTTGPATFHRTAAERAYRAPGDHRHDTSGAAFTTPVLSSYYLTAVEVAGPREDAVVAFGDSITDGLGSTVGGDDRYPDQLTARLGSAVLNCGITGNRLLTGTERYGESALARFARDVLARPGVRTVVVLIGVNDIGESGGDPAIAGRIVEGLRTLVVAAKTRGLRIVGATLTPFKGSYYDSPANEAARDAVNAWIRSPGSFDAVVDFDAALADPAEPDRMRAEFSAGSDGLHPNPAGFAAMAAAFDPAAL